MASLIEFHKWAGDRIYPPRFEKFLEQDRKVSLYREYLEKELHLPCKDTKPAKYSVEGTFSHWGSYANYIECRWDPDYTPVKPKRVDMRTWLKQNHPEVLREYRQAV